MLAPPAAAAAPPKKLEKNASAASSSAESCRARVLAGRLMRAFRGAPRAVQVTVALLVALTLGLAVNWTYQVVRKPSELFFPVSGSFYKESGRRRGAPTARCSARHSTARDVARPAGRARAGRGLGQPRRENLLALGSDARAVRNLSPRRRAPSACIRSRTARLPIARRYCIHDHAVAVEGPWYDVSNRAGSTSSTRGRCRRTPWSSRRRISIVGVAEMLGASSGRAATLQQQQNVAALIHLCGPGVAAAYARRGFAPAPGQRCGAHDVRGYLATVNAMRRVFSRRRVAESRDLAAGSAARQLLVPAPWPSVRPSFLPSLRITPT